MNKNLAVDYSKLFLAIVIGAYFFYCSKHFLEWHIIDNFDLIIHEAGHTIFRLLGEFVSILGGSLFQILIPLLFVGYFFFKKDYYSTTVLGSWLGYNFINVSVYINDAIDMNLPLLGGDSVIHDWNWLLSATGLLSKTHVIASFVHGFGLFIVTLGILGSIYYSRKTANA